LLASLGGRWPVRAKGFTGHWPPATGHKAPAFYRYARN
jgi:hypothetical protein